MTIKPIPFFLVQVVSAVGRGPVSSGLPNMESILQGAVTGP